MTLYMMVGIAGSGKSTKAKEIAELHNAEIFSSDSYRLKLLDSESDQSNNDLIFRTLYADMKETLLTKNVVFDACNLTIKSRKKAFNQIFTKGIEVFKVAYIVNTPIETIIEQNAARDRKVPESVIYRMQGQFQIPFYEEGFDEIEFADDFKGREKEISLAEISRRMDVSQNNPNHDFTTFVHCAKSSQYIDRHNFFMEDGLLLHMVALFHDIGKVFTESKDENGISHYYTHENVGAYLLTSRSLLKFEEKKDFLDFLFYINYHMLPFDWNSASTKAKYIQLFGLQKFTNLLLLHEADINSSKKQS